MTNFFENFKFILSRNDFHIFLSNQKITGKEYNCNQGQNITEKIEYIAYQVSITISWFTFKLKF